MLGCPLASSAWVPTLLPVAGHATVWALRMLLLRLGLRGYLEKAQVEVSCGYLEKAQVDVSPG